MALAFVTGVATNVFTNIATNIAGFSLETIGNELGYIISYKSNVDDLHNQLQTLEARKSSMQDLVDAATRNGEEILDDVKSWLSNVDRIVAAAKDFQRQEERESVRCFRGPFCYLCTRQQLSKQATDMVKEISQVLTERKRISAISVLRPLQVAVSSSVREYKDLDSRMLILGEILQALNDSNYFKIGVCGMGGVGKTTLINEVAWRAEKKDRLFTTVVVATVTNSPDIRRIQGEIADRLVLKFNEETVAGRATRLRERIKKEKSILIILDDIWEYLDLIEVGVPFGAEHRGCKLLLTSRDLGVLNSEMGTQKCFKLEVLSDEESWSLFEKMAGDVIKDTKIRPIALKVAQACAGLPLLVTAMAKTLQKKDLCAWRNALEQLTRFHQKKLPDKVHSVIELSFNNLATDELKSLFLLIGSFGQTTIWTKYLLIYFWSLGIYEPADTLANARNRLYCLVEDLKSSCLLLEGEREQVKMHDVVHEVANKIASRDRLIFAVKLYSSELIKWPQREQLKKCYRIFLPENYIPELPNNLDCPELEILVLVSRNNFLKVPDEFFSMTKGLKVLYLGGMDCTNYSPPSLCQLTNLRALYLRQCMLNDIAIIAELKKLEVLGFEHSEIRELPAAIGQLTHLRLLDLSNCSGLTTIPAKLISSLTCLEELYMSNTFIKWEAEESKRQNKNANLGELRHLEQLTALELLIEDASSLPKDILIFGKLERYKIYIGGGWNWSWKESTCRTLKLNQSTITSTHLDHGIKLLLDGVEDLSLSHLRGVHNVLYQLNKEGFPQLKHLNIQDSMEIQCIVDYKEWHHSCEVFPNLESLILHNLINMKEIYSGPLPLQSFASLKVFKVKGCDSLGNLLHSTTIELSQLVQVDICQCKTMSEIIVGSEAIQKIKFPKLRLLTLDSLPVLASFVSKPLTTDMQSKCVTESRNHLTIPMALFDEKINFPALESLKISSINLVKMWANRHSTDSFQYLKSLIIDDCGNIKYLFSPSMARGLLNLQHLNITGCGMMEEIFSVEGKVSSSGSVTNSLSSEEVMFPNLETLVISNMKNLKSVFYEELAPNPFPKLFKMEISFCPKLLSIFPSYVLNHLHKLETLVVTDCAALEVLFEIQGLNNGATSQGKLETQLKTLTLKHLPMLIHVWNNDPHGSLQFLHLCIVNINECESLGHVFPLSIAMELLQIQELDIRDCGVESIVAMGEMVEKDPKLVFPQLTTLRFWGLEKLKSFYPATHALHCPMLKWLDVYHCFELETFELKSQNYEVVPFRSQHLFSLSKVICSIEKLSLCSKNITSICNGAIHDDDLYDIKALSLQCFHHELDEFPMGFLQKFTNLEDLEIACSSFSEIFPTKNAETMKKLKTLVLEGLDKLKYLCKDESGIQSILRKLEILKVFRCSKLENIVSYSSLVIFDNLDKLYIDSCSGLVNIISSSTARNLRKLRDLWISNCKMVKQVVASEDDSDRCEIPFMKLECLVLQNLPMLAGFCMGNFSFKFPSLQALYVIECPKMKSFSHGVLRIPELRQVRLGYEDDEWCWNGELNTTIRKVFDKRVLFPLPMNS